MPDHLLVQQICMRVQNQSIRRNTVIVLSSYIIFILRLCSL